MVSTRRIRFFRGVLFLALLVLAQACQGAGPKDPTSARPPDQPKARVTSLSSCNGDRFSIDVLDAVGALPDDTLDAQREQLRDWIWTVTLGRIAQRTSADDVLSGVADEPLVRDDSLAHVLHMQVGPARATLTKSGGAIVLVEAADAATIDAEIAEALDEQALHLGSTPADAQIYQYVLQPEVARVEVCAMKALTRADLEGAARQFRSAKITTAAELETFLSGGVDLLSAQCTEGGLQVTGRQRPRDARTAFTVEHIAALSQARGTRYIPLARFGFSLDKLSNRAQLDKNARELDTLKAPIEIQPPDIQLLLAWKRQNPGVPMQELIMSLQLQEKAFGRPGFSLDPHTSVPFATTLLDDLISALPDTRKTAAILRGLGEDELARTIVDLPASTNEPFEKQAREALIAARGKLQKVKNDDEAEAILHMNASASIGSGVAADLLQAVWKRSGQQCARYDGPLTGTATGMTFFYTDLLAKIWHINWHGAAPESTVEGFLSGVHPASTAASCEDNGAQSTRIWFGVREEAFTREASGAVHFAPIAARIFAKSSVPGKSHEEFEATAESKRFVQWWDRHFPQIAGWEPQYEVLNQLMKWSVVVQSAAVAKNHACFALLDDVAVKSDRRIDKWVAQTSDLRWHGPVTLLRPKEGVKETPTDPECLDLLESERFPYCGSDSRSIVGGVSAATLEMVGAKAAPALETPAYLRRFGTEGKAVTTGADRVQFETVHATGGELKNVSVESHAAQVKFSAEIDPRASQVGSASSWDARAPVKQVEKSLQIQDKGLAGRETRNGLVSAELKSSDLTRAEVQLEVKPSTLQQAKSHGQKAVELMQQGGATLPEVGTKLASGQEVMHLDDGSIAVRVESGGPRKTWAIMESGGGNRGPPPPGTEASFVVGAPDEGPHRPGSSMASRDPAVRVSILEETAASSHFAKHGAKPLHTNEPTLSAVKAKLQTGDFEGAMKVHEQQPTPEAARVLFEDAVGRNDMKSAARVADHAIKTGASAPELGQLSEALGKQRVRLARENGALGEIDQLTMKLAIQARRRLTPGKILASSAVADSAVYAPTTYATGTSLPPAVHPPGKLLLPTDQYVTRVVEEASTGSLPPRIEVGGVSYENRSPGKEVPLSYSSVGSPFRLLQSSRRLVVVVSHCDDHNPDLPPCHDRPSPEKQKWIDAAIKCDSNRDGEYSTQEERECLDALRPKSGTPASPP